MSDTETLDAPPGDDPARTPAPSADPGTAQNPAPEAPATPPEPEQPKPAEPPKPSALQNRIGELTARMRAEERQRQEAEARAQRLELRLQALESGQPPDPQRQPVPQTQAEIERLANERAEKIADQRASQAAMDRIGQEGGREYTAPAFNAACNMLASLGAGDNATFMQAVAHLDAGHKVLHHLGNDPDEAMRLLAMPPARMMVELGRLETRLTTASPPPAPKPISAVAPPTRTVGATGNSGAPSIYDPNLTPAQYAALREKQRAGA